MVISNNEIAKALKVPSCKVDKLTNVITLFAVMVSGDVCLDNKNLVLIKDISTNKRQDVNNYEGISGDIKEDVYYYINNEKKLVTMKDNTIIYIDIVGYAITEFNTKVY